MYEIGEYIVHPGQGVCLVEDVVDNPSATYQLLPVGQRHPMRISFPVASESVFSGRFRGLLSGQFSEKKKFYQKV